MPPEDTSLVVYEKLYSFLHTLNYSPAQDQEAVARLLEMYRTDPAKTLALLNTLLYSSVMGQNPANLNPDLTATWQAENVEIPQAHYSLHI
jgi:hypothetical protein